MSEVPLYVARPHVETAHLLGSYRFPLLVFFPRRTPQLLRNRLEPAQGQESPVL